MNQHKCQFIKFIFILLFFSLLCGRAYGQNESENEQNNNNPNTMSGEDGKNYAPTYYYYINSLFPQTVEKKLIDTSVYNPYNEDVSLFSRNLYATLGIFGQANFLMNFSFYRKHGFSYKTLPYNSYLRTIENWRFFSPEGVYTNLQYNFSSGKENRFSVMHAQKITDNLHFDLGLETTIAEGRYVMQKIRGVNVGGSLRYLLPSNFYGFSAHYLINFIKNQENGGILHDALFNKESSPSTITVRFDGLNANNQLFQNTFFFRHYLALSGKKTGKKASKIEKMEKNDESDKIEENDENDKVDKIDENEEFEENNDVGETEIDEKNEEIEENEDEDISVNQKIRLGYLVHDVEVSTSKNLFSMSGFRGNHFTMFNFDSNTTRDFVKNFQLRNSFMWSSYMPEDTFPDKNNFIRFAAGITHTFVNVEDTTRYFSDIPRYKFRDNQLAPLGILYIKLFNRLHIKANAAITLNGYNAGDITLEGQLGMDFFSKNKQKHEAKFKFGFYNYEPDYFFTHWVSNNYHWENSFNLKKQQTITAAVAWEHKNYSVGLHYYTLNNFTLLNELSEPEQINSFVNVFQISAYVPFHFKGFGIISNMYAQLADNEKLPLPIFVTRQTIYYGFSMFKKALYLQVGVDFLYNTDYYANAYNPVLQQFNLQNNRKIGNYPYLDVFVRAKLNRFQFSVKATHVWAGLFGYDYYLVPHYPAKDFGFALGVLWHFYD